MLSIITIDASTIIPTPSIRPVSVIMLSVRPAKLIASSVMRIESGMEIEIMIVLLKFCKKIKRMRTARSNPCHADCTSVFIVSRIIVVSSLMISSVISDGSVVLSCSIFL